MKYAKMIIGALLMCFFPFIACAIVADIVVSRWYKEQPYFAYKLIDWIIK